MHDEALLSLREWRQKIGRKSFATTFVLAQEEADSMTKQLNLGPPSGTAQHWHLLPGMNREVHNEAATLTTGSVTKIFCKIYPLEPHAALP